MTECKYIFGKAASVPHCGHEICWTKFFVTNPGAFSAVRTIVTKYGEDTARKTVGTKYLKFYKLWEQRLKND